MSDTPETDANCWREGVSEWVAANFARELERERDELRSDQINHENLSMRYMDERDEARGWAEAAWAKSDRGEKMLRNAAAKADQWRECAEKLANALWAEVSGELHVNSPTHHALLEFEKLNGEAQ